MKKWWFVFAIPLALFLFCWGFVLGNEEGLYYREVPNTFEVRAAAGPLTMDEAKTLQYRRKYRDVEAESILQEFAIDLEQAKYIIENIDSYQVYTCEVTLENLSNGTIDGGRFVSEDPDFDTFTRRARIFMWAAPRAS